MDLNYETARTRYRRVGTVSHCCKYRSHARAVAHGVHLLQLATVHTHYMLTENALMRPCGSIAGTAEPSCISAVAAFGVVGFKRPLLVFLLLLLLPSISPISLKNRAARRESTAISTHRAARPMLTRFQPLYSLCMWHGCVLECTQ